MTIELDRLEPYLEAQRQLLYQAEGIVQCARRCLEAAQGDDQELSPDRTALEAAADLIQQANDGLDRVSLRHALGMQP